MKLQATYPTPQHRTAAETITEFFAANYSIDAVLLVNSCARGEATRDSCLDIIVLANPASLRSQVAQLEANWATFEESDPAIQALKTTGKYSEVHLDFIDGVFAPQERDEAAGPDDFELGIGNFLAYSDQALSKHRDCGQSRKSGILAGEICACTGRCVANHTPKVI